MEPSARRAEPGVEVLAEIKDPASLEISRSIASTAHHGKTPPGVSVTDLPRLLFNGVPANMPIMGMALPPAPVQAPAMPYNPASSPFARSSEQPWTQGYEAAYAPQF